MFDKIIDGFLQFGMPGIILAACIVYIYWQDKKHREERIAFFRAHREERQEFRESFKQNNDSLLSAIEKSNVVQRDLTVAIYELRTEFHNSSIHSIEQNKHDKLGKLS